MSMDRLGMLLLRAGILLVLFVAVYAMVQP
jgi:hypothetical protein